MNNDDYRMEIVQRTRERLEDEYWISLAQSGHPDGKPWALRKNSSYSPCSYHESQALANVAKLDAIELECADLYSSLTS